MLTRFVFSFYLLMRLISLHYFAISIVKNKLIVYDPVIGIVQLPPLFYLRLYFSIPRVDYVFFYRILDSFFFRLFFLCSYLILSLCGNLFSFFFILNEVTVVLYESHLYLFFTSLDLWMFILKNNFSGFEDNSM